MDKELESTAPKILAQASFNSSILNISDSYQCNIWVTASITRYASSSLFRSYNWDFGSTYPYKLFALKLEKGKGY